VVSKTLYQWKRSLGWFICSLELAFFGATTARSQEEGGSPQAPVGRCYLFILFYGPSGSKLNSERYARV
jgi:hypothetical protein